MRKLLSIGALTLTLVTCTSISASAAEALGNRNEAAKSIAVKVWKEKNVINSMNINAKTAVNKYANKELIDKITSCVTDSIKDKELAAKVNNSIEAMYKDGKGAKEIFEALSKINAENDITDNTTFEAAKEALLNMLNEFVTANEKGNLDSVIRKYFKVSQYGRLEYGKNSNNRRVVTLKNGSTIVFQVNSENVYNLKNELETRINSWSDLNDYFLKIK